MPTYLTSGHLTRAIEKWNVSMAQDYLIMDDMAEYLPDPLKSKVESIEWNLDGDGYRYYVEATTSDPLSERELRELSAWVSGQNSDGLGENFEQQDFAEAYDKDGDYIGMCSFDWNSNDYPWERVD